MEIKSFIKIILLFLVLVQTLIMASGSLKGIAVDSLTNERLTGANIIFIGIAMVAAPNIEGKYSIVSIPYGKYNVRC